MNIFDYNICKCVFANKFVNIIVRYTNLKEKHLHKLNLDNLMKKQVIWKNVIARQFDIFLRVLITRSTNYSNIGYAIDV